MRDLVFVIFAIAGLAMIQARTAQASPNLVQLKLYSSPSLKWELEIDPGDRHGRGKGSYRMLNQGKEVWKVEIPCTLCDAIVGDDGVTIGYGYGHGIEGFGAGGFKDGPGTLNVVIIDATGKVRLNDAIKREWSSYPHGFPVPCVREFVVHTAESQFALRLSGDDNEQWSAYRTETGERITNYSHNDQVAAGPKSKPLSLVPKNVDSLPIRELQALGSFVLGAPPKVQVIRDIAEFAFDEHGRIGFLRRERTGAMTIVIIDQDSHVIAESVLPLSDPSQSCIEWIAGERWIVTASGHGEDAKAQAWWFDAQKQTFSQIKGFHSPAVEKVCRANDGGFVVLATKRSRYQS
ncbi:MAG: hypothetical protein NTV80_21430, partial [Verrucomicrobia bacterium]|nr:hypothetical protein [Verrucomicrobiota bacterium]